MSVYYPSFNFLNKNSYDDYNLIVAHFDGDQGESDAWLGMDPIYSDVADGTRRIDYGAKFNSVVTPKITVIKSDGTDFTVSEVRKFLKWTTGSRKNSYLELCEWNDDNNMWEVKFRLLGRTTRAYQQKLDARTVGLIIEFTTVSPFAYSPVMECTYSINGTQDITIEHDTDDLDTLIYLNTEFENLQSEGSLTIYNPALEETTNVNNLAVNEVITLDSNGFIKSDKLAKTFGGDFNYVFPRFGHNADVLSVTGYGTITFKYIYFIKIGDCTIDVDVSYGGINCDSPPSGSGTGSGTGSGSGTGGTCSCDSYTRAEIDQMFANLTYEEITITSLSNNVGSAEKGDTINSVTLNWTVSKTPATLTLEGASLNISSTSYTYSGLNLTSNKTWTLSVTDERGATASKSTSITFLNGVYYGASSEPSSYNSDFVLSLTKRLSSGKVSSFSATSGEGQYIYYCLPTSMGACLFNVGGFDGGFTLVDTIEFVNSHGHSEGYYIYRSDNANLGTKTINVS